MTDTKYISRADVPSRRVMLERAYHECLAEMYRHAQPPLDYVEVLEKIRDGQFADDDNDPLYKHHYLSDTDAKDIFDRYVTAYRLTNEWHSSIDLLLNDIQNGAITDKYIEDKTDEDGNVTERGYRGYEELPPLVKVLEDVVGDKANEVYDTVVKYIKNRRDFYRFDREEETLRFNVFLGPMPTSNKDDVTEYWRSKGQDIEIKDRINDNEEELWETEEDNEKD